MTVPSSLPNAFGTPTHDHDPRLASPAVARNRPFLRQAALPWMGPNTTVLELGSGTGEHAIWLPRHRPDLRWYTSEMPNTPYLSSSQAWIRAARMPHVFPPVEIDLLISKNWEATALPKLDTILAINVLHIAPWPATAALFALARQLGTPAVQVVLYGPWRDSTRPLEPSNEAFDESLRARIPGAGVRVKQEATALAAQAGFTEADDVAMPANNRLIRYTTTRA